MTTNNLNVISEKLIAKNTLYNFLGYGIPMLFAVVLLPPLIKGLGDERFGILNLSWIVIGYFSFFDLGIGRSLTKIIAEKIGSDQTEQIPQLFWTSLILMLIISLIVSIIFIFFCPWLINKFNISYNYRPETLKTFYALAIAIPIVTSTAAVRGVLEAYQRFDIINTMRVFLGIFTFLGPLIFLLLTDSLFWIIVFLVIIRIIVWILYLRQCFKINSQIKNEIKINYSLIKPIFKFSMWITVANVVGPLMSYLDRFLIATVISAAAITYYATPYEVVTKLLLIPSSIVGVLFPVFSSSFSRDVEISKKLFLRSVKFIFIMMFPVVFLIINFSVEGMSLWLGENFAKNSSLILQFLALGVLLNSIAYIPFNFFQGVGKPNIPAVLNLIELPFYVIFMWIFIKNWGINGAAFLWLLRIIIDTIILFIFSNKIFQIKFDSFLNLLLFFLMIGVLMVPFFLNSFLIKLIFAIVFLVIFSLITWKHFLAIEEKKFIFAKLGLKIKFIM